MKKIQILSLGVLAGLMISCKKESKEKVLEEPIEVQYKVGEEEPEEAPVDPATAPVLVMEKDTYDLGEVKAGETVEKKVSFKNKGKGPLLIKDVKTSCGCTVPEYSKEPVDIGAEGSLLVKYTAPAHNAHISKTVTLFTNTVEGIEKFKITADVVGGVEDKEVSAAKAQPTPNL